MHRFNHPPDSDAALLVAARRDPAAFRAVFERHADDVYGYHLRRTGVPDAALDLTAETFARAWAARGRFRDERDGSALPWLFGIARYVLLASVEQHRIERRLAERLGVLAELGRAAADVDPQDAWLDGLDDGLAALPPAQREAVRLRVIEDMSFAEVGRELGTTAGAARVRVSRGLASLRHILKLESTEVSP